MIVNLDRPLENGAIGLLELHERASISRYTAVPFSAALQFFFLAVNKIDISFTAATYAFEQWLLHKSNILSQIQCSLRVVRFFAVMLARRPFFCRDVLFYAAYRPLWRRKINQQDSRNVFVKFK